MKKVIYISLTAALIISVIVSMSVGAMDIPIKQVIWSVLDILGIYHSDQLDDQYKGVLSIVRIPRVLMGILVGAALGISGAAIQGVFRNPLAESGLIGISAGASLMSALVIMLETTLFAGMSLMVGYYLLPVSAFIGAAVASILVYNISKTNGKPNIATMLLAGIAINALAGALTGLISFMADDQQLRNITFWMLGSLAGATQETLLVVAPFILIPVFILPFQGKMLNAFVLGESQAEQLGMRPSVIKRRVVLLATLAVGAAVSVSGIIGFVGLLVPHLIRLIGGVDNRYVLPASAIMGALVLTVADMLSRILVPPIELPIGVITALLGTPVFIYILIKDKKKLHQ
ncbi:FecCD family ABC transporter permease [Gynurincola endophyticus]|uniref:FecCD family ABC transporter permease n=1 Tax=Gynurincola endophyticus TaxID=2479004 RepID=UPI000F8C6CB1|nr:iron ABC transporter permease [Gynurincola endophyticus]